MLIKNGFVLVEEGIKKADLLIEEGRIVEIGRIEGKGDLDASHCLIIPAFFNTHAHVALTTMRGWGEGLPLKEWLEKKIWPAEERQEERHIYWAAKLGFCEMVKNGIVGFADMCIHDTKMLFKAADEVGVKGVIAQGVMDFFDEGKRKEALRAVKRTLEYEGKKCRAGVAVHAPYTASEELIISAKEIAKKKNAVFQMHVSETREEIYEVKARYGRFALEQFSSIMDERTIFAHCGWVTKREIVEAGKKKLNIAHCPTSNLKLATAGICQVREFLDAGANVCLGTDSAASNNALDMFFEMKLAALLQKHHYWDANIVSPKELFMMATRNGAKALGLEGGVIAKGAPADLIILKQGLNLTPLNDVYANLVYAASSKNILHVLIDGEVVVENRLLVVCDEEEVKEEASAAWEEIKN